MGDGMTSAQKDPTHVYAQTGSVYGDGILFLCRQILTPFGI